MGSEWKFEPIGKYAKLQGGFAFKSRDFKSKGIPVVKIKNVKHREIDLNDAGFVEKELADNASSFYVKDGNILICMTGSGMNSPNSIVGRVARYNGVDDAFLINQRVGRFLIKRPDCLDEGYLYYYLSPKDRQWELVSIATGSANQVNISGKQIESLEIPLPPLPTQRAIAHILGSIDDKIALNRRMNETLEQMAQALFKSWFVDFDPVIDKALAAGHAIPEPLRARAARREALGEQRRALPGEVAGLFPERFVWDEEMGWIPEGWGEKKIGSLVKSISETYPLKQVDEVIFLNTGDIQDGNFLHNNYSDSSKLPGQAKKSIKKGDVLYSEIRPKNKRYAFVHFDAPHHVVSTKLMVLRACSSVDSLFVYFILKQQKYIDHLQLMAESRSGTFPQITFDVLSNISIVLPDSPKALDFFTNHVLKVIFEKTIKNQEILKSLSQLRDTLLPKLISGELSVSEAAARIDENH